MSISTHRWQPAYKSKSRKRHKSRLHKRNEMCLIHVKFENSQYFKGSRLPNTLIYPKAIDNEMPKKDSKKTKNKKVSAPSKTRESERKFSFKGFGADDTIPSQKISSIKMSGDPIRRDPDIPRSNADLSSLPEVSASSNPNLRIQEVSTNQIGSISSGNPDQSSLVKSESQLEKKLFAFEYFIASNPEEFMRSKQNAIRLYILTNNLANPSQDIAIAENVKSTFNTNTWKSFRIIIINKEINVRRHLLRNIRSVDDDEDDKYMPVSYGTTNQSFTSEFQNRDDDEDATNTQLSMNEEEEEQYFQRVSQKFRDSRMIITPNLKAVATDPIDNCFNKLTKLIEDHIFSTNKNLTEANEVITEIQKVWLG